MLVQGNFAPLFRDGLRTDFKDEYQKYAPQYPSFLRTSTMDGPELKAAIISGLNRLVERGDGEAYTYDNPNMSNVVLGVDKEFALGFMLTKRTVEDDKYGKANQSAKWLGYATAMTEEYKAAQLLDDAFTGTNFKSFDNVSFINTAHPLMGSDATVSNRVPNDAELSVTGLTAMQQLGMQMKDENGNPMQMMFDKLIISNSASDLNKARQILGSQLEPFSANNADNALKQAFSGVQIVTSVYKASAKSYFMVDSRLNDAWFVTRRAPTFESSFDFNTSAALYAISTRFMIWIVDWRGWVGSNPS